MKQICVAATTVFAATAAFGETLDFDHDAPGLLPLRWEQGVTGKGNARWTVRPDASAPSQPHVLQQSGSAPFAWCVLSGAGAVGLWTKADSVTAFDDFSYGALR